MQTNTAYIRAQKRVREIKGFYHHAGVFIIVMLFFLVLRTFGFRFYFVNFDAMDPAIGDWLDWNLIFFPGIWLVVLIVHAVQVFWLKSERLRNWEQRKLKELLDKEQN